MPNKAQPNNTQPKPNKQYPTDPTTPTPPPKKQQQPNFSSSFLIFFKLNFVNLFILFFFGGFLTI
jgi:hypothetical protein